MVFGLENIRHILSSIGNPHLHLKAIHIAGTNGKGSVAAIISAILKEAGYRVGRYTSPHLHSFTERIVVDGKRIKEEEVVELTDLIRGRLDGKGKGSHFTFFDFTTAMAFEYFLQKGVDMAVVETGLGGRLDSTNVLDPLLSVITNVSFDSYGLPWQDHQGHCI
jgi:dihydrofolate synthase/folylpolyglutamate synthase